MSIVYIGIGSNLGDREGELQTGSKASSSKRYPYKKQSQMYETEPWGIKDQPKFINMAIEVETDKKAWKSFSGF